MISLTRGRVQTSTLENKSLYGHAITYSLGFVESSAVLTCGGISPAAATLRSLVRKLKVAHAFGCKD